MIIKDINGNPLKEIAGDTLVNANLYAAYLRGADLRDADLRGADLQGAYLQGADLQGAYLQGADLRGADLRGADLQGAYLRGADLWGADLWGADLRGAVLQDAKTDENTKWPHFQIVPEKGRFTAFKKLRDGIICELEIPISALRTSSLIGRKCRASKAKVISIVNQEDGRKITHGFSLHHPTFRYEVGKYVFVSNFDPDIKIECTNGIHFFMTRKEAEDYIG